MAEEIQVLVDDTQEEVSIYVGTPSEGVQSVVAGTNISVDNTDPKNPIVSSTDNKLFYEDIADMLANQAQQTEQITMCVADASADKNITFPAGETRLQAYYRYLGTTNGTMVDYELISAPYGNHTGGGDAAIAFQAEITDTDTIFDGTQKGTGKIYPFNKETAQTVTIEKDDYSENDTINIERRGLGTLEVVQGTDVRFRGVRDEENRFFINDPNSMASLICRGSNEFSIIGNLKRGSLGAVTISSYLPALAPTETRNITVTGTGFSANMVITVTGNATLNSWTYVSETEITLNITSSGVDGDFITVTYDNGDIFEDTNAIELVDVEYVATNYPFDSGFGLFKMNASQVYAIRVRRSSDNAETDVGFNENYKVRMDSPVSAGGDLTSWIGSDDGFIVKMYDQGSVGDDMVQASASAQPKLITAGVMNIEDGYPFIVFDGVDDYMEQSTARQWGNGNDNTYALMCKTHSVSGDKVAFTDRPSSGFHSFFLYTNNKASFNSGNVTVNSASSTTNTVYKHFAVRAIGGTSKLYVDGTLVDSDTGVTSATFTNKLRLGISTATAQNVKLNHAIIWKSNKDANQSDISTIINGFI